MLLSRHSAGENPRRKEVTDLPKVTKHILPWTRPGEAGPPGSSAAGSLNGYRLYCNFLKQPHSRFALSLGPNGGRGRGRSSASSTPAPSPEAPQGVSVLRFLYLIFTIAPLKEPLRHFFPHCPLYEVLILQIYFTYVPCAYIKRVSFFYPPPSQVLHLG